MHRLTSRKIHAILIIIAVLLLVIASTFVINPLQHSQAKILHTTTPASGCGKRPPITPGNSANETIVSGGLKRMYRLHVPLDYRAFVKYTLVLNFHGHGSNALKQERLTGMSRLADQDTFLVAYPQGTIGPDGRTGWNTGPWNYPHVDDIGFTNDLITQVEATFCVNPQSIYATGFSNGGGFTNVLACKLASRIAAFAIVSGGMHPVSGGCQVAQPVPLLEIHGTADRTVPYNGNPANDSEPPLQQWLKGWARRDGCAPTPSIFLRQQRVLGERWSACKGNVTITHYRITGGVHTWPRITRAKPNADGNVLDATKVVWQFFKNVQAPLAGAQIEARKGSKDV